MERGRERGKRVKENGGVVKYTIDLDKDGITQPIRFVKCTYLIF